WRASPSRPRQARFVAAWAPAGRRPDRLGGDMNDANGTPPDPGGHKPLPIPLGLPPVPAVVGVATRERPKAKKESRPVPWGTLGVVALVLGALGAAGLVLLLPWYIRSECVEQAASHGITLTIGDVAVSPS